MATKKARPNGRPDVPILYPPPTPAELRALIRATLGHWFPHCEDAALAFIPGPGMPPLELWVAGDTFAKASVSDDWYTGNGLAGAGWPGAGRWNPPDDEDDG